MLRSIALFGMLIVGSVQAQKRPPYDLQGHRGCRGLMPENTIPAFLKALDLGVNTLELDVVISKDGQVVVSHEPYFNAEFSQKPDGTPVTKAEQAGLNLYLMTYEEIQQYDVGSRGNARFPEQQKLKAYKPLLSEVVSAVATYCKEKKRPPVAFNIELKSEKSAYNKSQPEPARFCELVHTVLTNGNVPGERVVIQSFDFAILKWWKNQFMVLNGKPVRLAALVENIRGIEANLEKLGFIPAVYSPYFQLLGQDSVDELHKKGMLVIPWTVNDPADMRRMLKLGVDGLITDYPDRAKNL